MFKQQQIIVEASSALREVLNRYQWRASPENWLDLAEQQARHFVVPLPFVGEFSAGKSSLINALIGEPLFSTNIDPETAFPAELSHGDTERLIGHCPDGTEITLAREDIQSGLSSRLPKGSHLSVTLSQPLLARLPHLRLVDMPGWSSGIEAHANAIDSYAAHSLAYCVVVSAEEGTLRDSTRRALRELAVSEMPILAIITKSDKKPADDIDAVSRQIQQDITSAMGRAPFATARVSARKKQLTELIHALEQLEGQTAALFRSNVVLPYCSKLLNFADHLETLINHDDLDSEQIQAQCDRMNQDLANFDARLEDETRQLDTRMKPVLGKIIDHIHTTLEEDIQSLTSDAINGADISASIGSLVRLAAQEGIAQEFNPEIQRYLNRVADGLPEDFSPDIDCHFDARISAEKGIPTMIVTPLLQLLTPLLKFVPQLKVISTVVLGIASLLEKMFADSKQQEIEEARQYESVQRKITGEIIPEVLRQVRSALQPMLAEHIESARQKIADTVHAQQQSHAAAFQELQIRLAEGQAAFSAARKVYEADRAAMLELINRLEQVHQ